MVLKQTAKTAKNKAKQFRKLLGKLGAKTQNAEAPLESLADQPIPPGMDAEQWQAFLADYQANAAEVKKSMVEVLTKAQAELTAVSQSKDSQTSEHGAESRKERWDVTLDSLIGVGCLYRLTLGTLEAAVNPAKAAGLVLTIASTGKLCLSFVNRLAGVAWGLNKSRAAWDQEVNKAATDRILDWVSEKGKELWEKKRTQKVADKNFADRLDYLAALQHERDEVHEQLERLERRRDELTALLTLLDDAGHAVFGAVEDARGSLIKLRAVIDQSGEPTGDAATQLQEEVKQLNAYMKMVRKYCTEDADPIRADLATRGADTIAAVTQALEKIDALIAHYDRETWTSDEFQKRLEGAKRGAADGGGQFLADLGTNVLNITPIVASTVLDSVVLFGQSVAAVATVDVFRVANIAKASLHLLEDYFALKRGLDNRAGTVGSAGISAEGDLANFFDHFDRKAASDHALQLWDFLMGFDKEFRSAPNSVSAKRRAKAVEILHAYQETLVDKAAKERAVFERTVSNSRRYVVSHNEALGRCEKHLRDIEQAFDAKLDELTSVDAKNVADRMNERIQICQRHLTKLGQLQGNDADKKLIAEATKRIKREVEQLESERSRWTDLPTTYERMCKIRAAMEHDAETLIRKLRTEKVGKKLTRIPRLWERANKKRAESRDWIRHFQIVLAPPGGPPCEIPPLGDRLDPLPAPELPELVTPTLAR